jgi:hypothetical protein
MPTFTGSTGNDRWNIGQSGGTFTFDGLEGIDTITLGQARRSEFNITKDANGVIHVDTISAGSAPVRLTLINIERLVFSSGADTLDLTTYFGDTLAPTISSFDPGLDARNVIPNKDIVLTFNEAIVKGTGVITVTTASGAQFASYNVATSPNVTVSGNKLTINPSSDLSFGTGYKVNLANGVVKDIAGNAFSGNNTYSFATAALGALIGTANADVITGTNGNDIIIGAGGNDAISGGTGIDTAQYTGQRSEYTLTGNLSNLTVKDNAVTARDGTDTLNQVERLQFSDLAVAFDINGSAGQAYRIYQAAFGRKPDLAGLGYWINDMDKGSNLTKVAAGFFSSTEFQSLYGTNPSTTVLINNFYQNVLQRAPDQAGFNYWFDQLSTGKITPAGALASFTESSENIAQVLGAIQNGIDYVVYVG